MIGALVNYYDEDPELLFEMVCDLHKIGVKCVFAIDGPYMWYPADKDPLYEWHAQARAIMDTCAAFDMSCDLRLHRDWPGSEIEKRQYLLDIGVQTLEASDWLLIWDADFSVQEPINLNYHLPKTKLFGDFTIHEENTPQTWRNRPLLPATLGMTYVDNHHTIVFPHGVKISTGLVSPGAESLGELLPMTIEHHRLHKSEERRERQQQYYDKRDKLGIEG